MAEIVTQTQTAPRNPSTEKQLAHLAATVTVLGQRLGALEERIEMVRSLVNAALNVPPVPMPGVPYPPGVPPGLSPTPPFMQPGGNTPWHLEMQHLDNVRKLQQIQKILAGALLKEESRDDAP
jgi:hypothetical protein